MNYFKKNMDLIYETLQKRYERISKTAVAQMLEVSQATLKKYWEGDGNPDSIWLGILQSLKKNLEKYGIVLMNDPRDIVTKDLTKQIEHYYKIRKLMDVPDFKSDTTKLGEFLKKIREEKNLSMKEVALKSIEMYPGDKSKQLTDIFVLRCERSKTETLNIKKLKTLSQIYEVPFERILEFATGVKNPIVVSRKEITLRIREDYLKKHNLSPKEVETRLRALISGGFPGYPGLLN